MPYRYGHVAKLAKKQKAGVDSVPGCEGVLYQVSVLRGDLPRLRSPGEIEEARIIV